jgi:myo-inositol-1(or 4)-monophosphatase
VPRGRKPVLGFFAAAQHAKVSMHPMLNIAVKAARRAGGIIARASEDLDLLTVRTKSNNEFVSEVDHAAEEAIVETLLAAYPDHAILAEERGAQGQSEYVWIIDPLDGTTNFLHGFPQYSVSIACRHRGVLVHAVVFDPTRNELFTASRGRGAFLNDRRLRVSKRAKLADSLIGTGFPFRDFSFAEQYLKIFAELMTKTAGIRRPGSAALDLAYVAAGRTDGFFEAGLKSWDMAAGALLVLEAGGLIADFDGEEGYLESGNVVGGNPKVFAQLLQVVQSHTRK